MCREVGGLGGGGWGRGTLNSSRADLENTIDVLKRPSCKGSAGGAAQQLTCFDMVSGGVCVCMGGGEGGPGAARTLSLSRPLLLLSCTMCEHERGKRQNGQEFMSAAGQRRLILAVHQGQRGCGGGGPRLICCREGRGRGRGWGGGGQWGRGKLQPPETE